MVDTNLEWELAKGETDTQDFKQEVNSALKIAKTLVAFANTKGGRLWIGVKDNGRVVGCETLEEQYVIEHAATDFCRPIIVPEFISHTYDHKELLEVKISISDQKPHYAKDEEDKWWVYVRSQDHTVLAGIVTLEAFKKKNKDILIKYSDTERLILKYIFETGKTTLNEIIKALKLKRSIAIMIISNLIATNVIQYTYIRDKEYLIIE